MPGLDPRLSGLMSPIDPQPIRSAGYETMGRSETRYSPPLYRHPRVKPEDDGKGERATSKFKPDSRGLDPDIHVSRPHQHVDPPVKPEDDEK